MNRAEREARFATLYRVRNLASHMGLCPDDAWMLSFAAVYGDTQLTRPPCDNCRPIVARLPRASTYNRAWRTLPLDHVDRQTPRPSLDAVLRGNGGPQTTWKGR